VDEWNNLENRELQGLFRKHFLRGAAFLLLLVALIFFLALSFEPQIREMADWLTNRFGFLGLTILVFVADLIISPLPPDAALFFIGKSQMHSQWPILVPVLGLTSTMAGVCGWLVGRRLQHLPLVQRWLSGFAKEHEESIRRFGFWMVVLGALTPLPYSITCWMAGIFQLSFKRFFIASLFRVPRFVIYYWAIFYSGEIGSMIRTFF
jgi:membrane protein YqaA with SNARE-associated domain